MKLERKKETNERLTKDKIIRDVRTPFEQEKEDHYKSKRVNNFWNNNYIEYENNGDKSRNLTLKEYLNKIKPYLKNIIHSISALNIMQVRSNNMKFTSYHDANEVVDDDFLSPVDQ